MWLTAHAISKLGFTTNESATIISKLLFCGSISTHVKITILVKRRSGTHDAINWVRAVKLDDSIIKLQDWIDNTKPNGKTKISKWEGIVKILKMLKEKV